MEKSFEQEKEELAAGMVESDHQTMIRREMTKIREEGIIKENGVTDTHKVIYEAEKRVANMGKKDMKKYDKNEILKVLESNKITNFYTPEDQIKMDLNKVKEEENID